MESESQEITKNFRKNKIFPFYMRFDAIILADPKKSMNLPNWTGGCTRHEVRVAIEVKHLMRALGGPHEYFGAPKNRPREEVFRGAEVLVGAP